jgi:hypothetical protein
MERELQKTKRAELTKYPNIYKHVYWGWGKGDIENDSYSTPQIIENRNRFIEEHNIKCFFKLPAKLYYNKGASPIFTGCNQHGLLDHRECYLTKQNTVIILCSPYGDANMDILCHCYGLKETYEMYGNGAKSGYIEVENNFNKKYMQTRELEKYWGKPTHELIERKKGFLYWMRVMYYEQECMKKECDKSFYDLVERDTGLILDYMTTFRGKCPTDVYDNLYEYHKFVDDVRSNSWRVAVEKTM